MTRVGLLVATVFGLLLFVVCVPSSSIEQMTANTDSNLDNPHQEVQIRHRISYETHGPILIMNDTDLADQALSEGWDGSGSPIDPYVIEGLNITSSGSCIEISDVRKHIIIQDCFLANSTLSDLSAGISMFNVSNVVIHRCVTSGKNSGVFFFESSNITVNDCDMSVGTIGVLAMVNTLGSPTQSLHISNCSIRQMTYGMYLQNVEGAVTHCNISYSATGININNAFNLTVERIRLFENSNGIVSDNVGGGRVDYSMIADNTIFNTTANGITGEFRNCTIFDNEVFDNTGVGMYFGESDYNNVTHNTIYNNEIGIFFESYCDYNNITYNVVRDSTDNGLELFRSDFLRIEHNTIFDNLIGLLLEECDYSNVTHNVAFDNVMGVALDGCRNTTLSYNDVGWSSSGNAADLAGYYNKWDDGSSIGNWWSDYSGTGDYEIETFSSGQPDPNYDHFPSRSVWMETPSDIDMEFGTTGNLVSWHTSILNRLKFEFYRNDTPIADGAWVGTNFTHSIDGLEEGTYNFTLRVYHVTGRNLTRTRWVDVTDTLGPAWIEPPTDQLVEFGDWLRYNLNASDPSGIDNIWLNDTTYLSIDLTGVISNNTILNIGFYSVEVWMNDTYGHTTSLILNITVDDTLAPAWTVSPSNQNVEFGDDFTYDLDAIDISGIDYWWVNDTTRFQIDAFGVITNTIPLDVGVYWLEIHIFDIHGNNRNATISVTVSDTTAPSWATAPTDSTIDEGAPLEVWLIVTDLSEITDAALNDTTHFLLSTLTIEGGRVVQITSAIDLEPGIYGVQIQVTDFYGNVLTDEFGVIVRAADTTPPVWVIAPTYQTLTYGQSLDYQLSAIDESGILNWSVDDTEHFVITFGRVTSIGVLDIGEYPVNVSVYDTYGNMLSGVFTVFVVQPTTTTATTTAPFDLTQVFEEFSGLMTGGLIGVALVAAASLVLSLVVLRTVLVKAAEEKAGE
ncbi:MAG: right-handed parallel beta-helix repeat-containing protein [Candidatus Thorarchaeota archaeon]